MGAVRVYANAMLRDFDDERRLAEVQRPLTSQILAVTGQAGLCSRRYRVANLFEATVETLAALGRFDKMLIDPPLEGALELIKALDSDAPQRIVYISCSPATLARYAAILVAQKSYQLRGAGVINMFPHTSHVESIALFERSPAS